MNEPSPLFNRYAESYDETLQKALNATGESAQHFLQRRVAHILGRLSQQGFAPRSILDFGCGIGNAIPEILVRFPGVRLVGVDLSQDSIQIARRRFRDESIELLSMDEFVPSEQFDLVYCNGVFHHVFPEDRPDVLQIILRSLRPGGIFVLCDNNPWNPGTRYVTWKTEFDKDAVLMSTPEARRRLRQAGFAIQKTDYLFIFPRCLKWFQPLERFVVSLPLGGQYIVFASKDKEQ